MGSQIPGLDKEKVLVLRLIQLGVEDPAHVVLVRCDECLALILEEDQLTHHEYHVVRGEVYDPDLG